jgi:hypothetical protein
MRQNGDHHDFPSQVGEVRDPITAPWPSQRREGLRLIKD